MSVAKAVYYPSGPCLIDGCTEQPGHTHTGRELLAQEKRVAERSTFAHEHVFRCQDCGEICA